MEALSMLKGSIALLLKLFTICIHAFGLYLLKCIIKKGKENVQMVYIVNLSATELIINMFSFTRNFVRLIPASESIRTSHTYSDIEMYSYILDYHLKFCLYMWMLYITIDRVFGVLLNFKYSKFWGTAKAKLLVGLTWLLAVIALIYILVTYIQNEHEESHIRVSQFFETANCFVMVFDFSFVATSVTAYLFIFCKYKQSQESRYLQKTESESTKNVWQIFRHSRFYVSVLLISTYIVFTIIPDLLWTFEVVRQLNIQYLMTIMYSVSNLADGIIYIFMHDRVKRMLYRKLNKLPFFKQRWQLLVKSRSVTSEWSTESVLSRKERYDGLGKDGSIHCKDRRCSAVSPASKDGSVFCKNRGSPALSTVTTLLAVSSSVVLSISSDSSGIISSSFHKDTPITSVTATLDAVSCSLNQDGNETVL